MVSAVVLCGAVSCGTSAPPAGDRNVLTMRGNDITSLESENGRLTTRYFTPLMEKYEFAPEPYEEYRYGVDIVQYDSLGGVESTFRASYAIHRTRLQLWEAWGDVVVTNAAGDRLETQQLFWNRATKRIYSNVDSHFFRGRDVLRGDGFESDEDFNDWIVRRSRGTLWVDASPTPRADSIEIVQDSLAVTPLPEMPEDIPEL